MGTLLTIFMYLIGIFWIVMGALLVFVPDLVKNKFMAKMLKNANLKKIGTLPLIIGVLLLLSASYNRYTFFVTLLGLLGILKGILIIVSTEKMKKITDWWLKANSNICRIWGILIIVIGSIVLIGI